MLEKANKFILIILIFLTPLLFLPITSEFYDFNKNALLYFSISLLLIFWVLEIILKKRLRFITTPLDLPVLLFATGFFLSFLIQSVNKKEVLVLPSGMGTILALTLLYFFITQIEISNSLLNSFLASASLLAVTSLFFFLEWWKAWGVKLPDWLGQKFFSPTGALLPQAIFLAIALTLGVTQFRARLKERQPLTSILYYPLSIILLLFGLLLTFYQLFTVQKPAFLPYSFAWAIAVETFKNLRSALFGVGPGQFLSAFTRFKPFGFNGSSVWNLRFTTSANWYLHLLTETGILGLFSYLFLVFRIFKNRSSLLAVRCSLFAIFILQLFLPPNFLLSFSLFVLLALYALGLPKKEVIEESKILPWLITILSFSLLFLGLYPFGQAYAAEIYFKRSLDALSKGKGADAYNLQIKTLNLVPYRTNYRLAYSQTNFALANSIAGQADLTDQDRANISQLIGQAIREAKIAINLDPINVIAWENLAGLYRNLVNFAQGADQWTLATYAQAISLDPLNPQLRIALGGIYYSLGNFDEAERIFRIAVDLKPDFANAHYNLAAVLREKGEYQRAAQEMQTTLSLVEPETNDFQKASGELEELRAKIPEAKEATPAGELETLSPPATPPEGIKPPLKLGEEAQPEITPLPSPTVTPTP